jgi:hypothetical protein
MVSMRADQVHLTMLGLVTTRYAPVFVPPQPSPWRMTRLGSQNSARSGVEQGFTFFHSAVRSFRSILPITDLQRAVTQWADRRAAREGPRVTKQTASKSVLLHPAASWALRNDALWRASRRAGSATKARTRCSRPGLTAPILVLPP